ncbi:MAG: hypothetical protein RLZZ346_1641, partial [Cyanobacteriota bacterium]
MRRPRSHPLSPHRLLSLATGALSLGLGLAPALIPHAARADVGNSSGFEFRWDNDKEFRKLYYFTTSTVRLQRAEYYFILKPKDRKTAILK